MGEIIAFPSGRPDPSGTTTAAAQRRPTETVFQDRGWRILELPSAGQFLAVSDYCRRGIEVGRFDPHADCGNHHHVTAIALLTRSAAHERLARYSIAWLNSVGPP